MDFLRSRSLFACGLVEDGDLIRVAILVLRDTHVPGPTIAYIDGREDRAIALEVEQGAGFHCDNGEGKPIVLKRVKN